MHVSDQYGQSVVVSNELALTKLLFHLQDWEYEKVQAAFEIMDSYRYDLFDRLDSRFPALPHVRSFKQQLIFYIFKLLLQDNNILKELITRYVESINKFSISSFDLKVRLVNNGKKKPLWYCLDARRTVNL